MCRRKATRVSVQYTLLGGKPNRNEWVKWGWIFWRETAPPGAGKYTFMWAAIVFLFSAKCVSVIVAENQPARCGYLKASTPKLPTLSIDAISPRLLSPFPLPHAAMRCAPPPLPVDNNERYQAEEDKAPLRKALLHLAHAADEVRSRL